MTAEWGLILTEDEFVEYYGSANGRFGSLTMPLQAALQMEKDSCLAPDEKRTDPLRRLGYLAGRVAAAGELHPEHAYLLTLVPED